MSTSINDSSSALETAIRAELPDVGGKPVEVLINENIAMQLTEAFIATWGWNANAQGSTARTLSPEHLSDTLREILRHLYQGQSGRAAAELITLLECLQSLDDAGDCVKSKHSLQ